MTTTVRLPPRVEQALAAYCVENRRTKSEVIVELLEQRLMGSSTARTPYELAHEAGFIGCVASDPKAKPAVAGTKARVAAAIRKKHGKTANKA